MFEVPHNVTSTMSLPYTFIRVPNNSYIRLVVQHLSPTSRTLAPFRFILDPHTHLNEYKEIVCINPVMQKHIAPMFDTLNPSLIIDILEASNTAIDTVVIGPYLYGNDSLINFHILLPTLQTRFPHTQFIGENALVSNQIVIETPKHFNAMMESLRLAQRIQDRAKGCLE